MSFPFIGIDGCKAGWFCVALDDKLDWDFRLLTRLSELSRFVAEPKSVLIDMPIGFLDAATGARECDNLARQLLSPKRHTSVFSTPARKTLSARNYQEALTINRAMTGRGISIQAWMIVPKMIEVDQVLDDNPHLRKVMRESHPEICFWALNKKSATQFRKKEQPGQAERLAILKKYFPAAEEVFQQAQFRYLRRQLARDDILDAMVNSVTALRGYPDYHTLPEQPGTDAKGLAMEMVYAAGN